MKKVLRSACKMNTRGNVVALEGDQSYTQNKETSKDTRINREQGQYVMCFWAPVKEGKVVKEREKALKCNRFSILATESEDQRAFT